jgi:hypothetical protein
MQLRYYAWTYTEGLGSKEPNILPTSPPTPNNTSKTGNQSKAKRDVSQPSEPRAGHSHNPKEYACPNKTRGQGKQKKH